MKDGQKIQVEKRTMPGYVLVNMEMTDDAWSLVKNTPGVTGFVGSRNKPMPLSQPEVDRLLHRETAERPRTRAQFDDRRDRQGHLRPAVRLLRRDRRDQRGRRQAQGAGLDLRPRDPGRGRLRPGEEDLGSTAMAKKVLTLIKLQIPAGAANPAPPVGPALGQHGVNIMEFCKAFNAQTQQDAGTIIPVEITVFEDRSFTFITKTPPAAVLIKRGGRDRQGLGRAARREGRHDHRGPGAPDRRAQDARPERQRPRRGDEDHRRHRPLDGRRRRGAGEPDGPRQALPRAAYEKVDRDRQYAPAEAVALVKETATHQVRRDRRAAHPARRQRPPRRGAAARHPGASRTGSART